MRATSLYELSSAKFTHVSLVKWKIDMLQVRPARLDSEPAIEFLKLY